MKVPQLPHGAAACLRAPRSRPTGYVRCAGSARVYSTLPDQSASLPSDNLLATKSLSRPERRAKRRPSSLETQFEKRKQLFANWRYPRPAEDHVPLAKYRHLYDDLANGEERHGKSVRVKGRITTCRIAGSELVFLSIFENEHRLQVVLRDFSQSSSDPLASSFARGDIIAITGVPYRSPSGELSILSDQYPEILSPCFHDRPNPKNTTISYPPELLSSQTRERLIVRSQIIRQLREFLQDDGFIEVDTPILSALSSQNALASPFVTIAKALQDQPLSLRIAPELWLKRLMVAGFDRVFEIGPSFRNEGIDATHNPEFLTCEFYCAHRSIDSLISTTEDLIIQIAKKQGSFLQEANVPFARLPFVPTLEKELGRPWPKIMSRESLLEIFEEHEIDTGPDPTIAGMLDKLQSRFIEPKCGAAPTWITNHPAAMSPLACTTDGEADCSTQTSPRAELFIRGIEIVNCYEEQNDPEQQRKAMDLDCQTSADRMTHEEKYSRTLEWGLPPTGGWGCGIDRLVMLFTDSARISHVRSFGGLHHVVSRSSAVPIS